MKNFFKLCNYVILVTAQPDEIFTCNEPTQDGPLVAISLSPSPVTQGEIQIQAGRDLANL